MRIAGRKTPFAPQLQSLLLGAALLLLCALIYVYLRSQDLWLDNFRNQERLQVELQMDQVWRAHAQQKVELDNLLGEYSL